MIRILNIIFLFLTLSSSAFAKNNEPLKKLSWPFDGIFGSVDRKAAQRGFQIYKEVCSACHSMNQLYYRNLIDLGFSEEEVKELARSVTIKDGPGDDGEMFDRPGIPSDKFIAPFPNEQAARSANNGSYPADLSLIIKARSDGANYVYSLLTGYENPPEGFNMMEGLSYNRYFPNHQIAMPQPLSDGMVTYSDGTPNDLDQMSRDIVVFLQWAAEPEMERRKAIGLKSMLFLTAFTVIFYLTKKRIWARLKD